ncbi:sterile alpha motif domain-containing protein 9-like isoform X1 [Fundulus heteroclitus]|uniref:sterile alpha motif domain-containing protein 9-like isoform X1 n=1 Tax=Fundulus heteroclitus TaxID=8078 RepID=UPI00165B7E5C|nr:sterile alpha motif domain-containing protein 9-like isoform X1 [Fundulus heteroclitus]XP_036003909.1 sterile alpha motif domain-containing protein 9-like isoform X1 [Fundulus heteroclitus]
MAEQPHQLPRQWTESEVSHWLRSIGVKETYIQKLYEEEVDGQCLLALDEHFLVTKVSMKSGPANLIIKRRDELINFTQKPPEKNTSSSDQTNKKRNLGNKSDLPKQKAKEEENVLQEKQPVVQQCVLTKEDCRARPFDKDPDFIYVKHRVLQPESGAFNLINPCREFKSLANASQLDNTRLRTKFAREVLKFATGCMNVRTNGTIHFGVMDSREDADYVHGEIIGIPIKDKDVFVDALDFIERSFSSDKEHIRQCVRPPRFIEVMDHTSVEKRYVVEVDIVPSISIVRGKIYKVRLPNFKESANKVEFEKETVLRRVGSKTEPVGDTDQLDFFQRIQDRDAQREEAEKYPCDPEIYQNLGRKLTMLMTRGKKSIEKEKWFILVTNKFKPNDLCHIDWLLNMNIFCVFDFDPDSNISGLCSKYSQSHAANMHSLQSYQISRDTTIKEFTGKLLLFEQTSWIFCNGRSDFKGSEPPCDDITWTNTKRPLLRESISLICKHILPKGTFQVIFLLTSPVEKPLLHTFYEFSADMQGHEDIVCICELEEDFLKWESFAGGTFGADTVNNHGVVGMKMSHINATLQQLQPVTAHTTKHLPTFAKGKCCLETRAKEDMYSLEILAIDHCDETVKESVEAEKQNTEQHFYHGGKVTWLHLWLAEHKHVGDIIERDAYSEVFDLLEDLKSNTMQVPVKRINIYHHPGSGGSTVARQVLWRKRTDLRCAVVKPSYSADVVAHHAVKLREHDENDPQRCLPVMLLVEDSEQEYLDDLKNELEDAIRSQKILYEKTCFILLSCRRCHDPAKKTNESPLENVSVTHKLSPKEKRMFSARLQELEEQYEPEFILTFVLMSEEFKKVATYVKKFVTNLLQGIDHESGDTRFLLYVALLNTYVQNSFISQSHYEALQGLSAYVPKLRQPVFETSLNEHMKLIFLYLRDEKTHIESIKIIHPRVAEEILKQLLGDQKRRGSLAKELLAEKVLFEHRFGRDDYLAFLKALLNRRSKVSRGDENDTLFSPLIDYVRKNESLELALELLKEAYECFHKDAFFAQTIARLYYSYEKFEEAKLWAETAATTKPDNSYILNTKGQVYKRWFEAKLKATESNNIPKTAKNMAPAVDIALTAMECFQQCQKVAEEHPETMNKLGFFAEVEVGCRLLKLISSIQEFAHRDDSSSECIKYLITQHYIPEGIKDAWEPFHGRLKNLKNTIKETLDWISEDLSYFQKDIVAHEEETSESPEETVRNPLKSLSEASSDYGKYLGGGSGKLLKSSKSVLTNLNPDTKRMIICRLGGGNLTSIFYKLNNQQERDTSDLQTILSLYPSNPVTAKFPQKDIINYIAANIALKCLSPQSPGVAALQDLQALSHQFPNDKRKCSPSALFLLTMLFWPEDHDKEDEKNKKYEIVQSAIEYLTKDYWKKIKDIPPRRRRLFTHFFLGNGTGLDKFVHKSKIERYTKRLPVHEKRMKWHTGEAWKMPELAQMLKSFSGWTEDGVVYLEGPKKKKFSIQPLYLPSVPYSNQNVTFYLGFTFRGPVAYNITVCR